MTEPRFLADVQRMAPGIVTRLLPPGATIDLGNGFAVEPDVIPGVTCTSPQRVGHYEWRPDRGVPPLSDPNRLGRPPWQVWRRVADYLGGQMLADLNDGRNIEWLRRMSRLEAVWRLEIVYPSEAHESRLYRFVQGRCEPVEGGADDLFVSIHTTVAATLILDALDANLTEYHANVGSGGRRISTRLYEPSGDGIRCAGGAGDDPLRRAIMWRLDERFLEKELKALGY
jgi:hypothetical protein